MSTPRQGRHPWASRVVELMRAQGLTRPDLAERLGVSERTVRNVLDGAVSPDPGRVRHIAEIVGVSPLTLFRDLDWLTAAQVAGSDSRVIAAAAVESLHDRNGKQPRGAWLLVDRAAELGTYRAHLVPAHTSSGEPWRDYVGLTATAPRGTSRDGMPDEDLQRQLYEDFAVALKLAPALLEDSAFYRKPMQRTVPAAQAWFWVPHLLATREVRMPRPLAAGVDTVVVVGEHGAGADDIGAYLADRGHWGYVNTSLEAQRAFARNPRDQAEHAQRCLDLTEAYLRSPQGRYRVIAHGNPATSTDVIRRVQRFEAEQSADDPHRRRVALVYARADDTLIEYGSRVWGTRMDPVVPGQSADYRPGNDEAMAAYADQVGRTSGPQEVQHRAVTVPVALEEEHLSRRGYYQKEVDRNPMHRNALEQVWPALHPMAEQVSRPPLATEVPAHEPVPRPAR